MVQFLKANKYIVFAVIAVVVIALTSFMFLMNSEKKPLDFGWNAESSRDMDSLGIDSSLLRTKYQYQIDPESYYPLYEDSLNDCTVLSRFDSYKPKSTDELTETNNVLASYTGQPLKLFKDAKLRFEGDTSSVPVRTVSYSQDGKYFGVLARVFAQEKLKVIVLVSCGSEKDRDTALDQSLQSIQIVNGKSTY